MMSVAVKGMQFETEKCTFDKYECATLKPCLSNSTNATVSRITCHGADLKS